LNSVYIYKSSSLNLSSFKLRRTIIEPCEKKYLEIIGGIRMGVSRKDGKQLLSF